MKDRRGFLKDVAWLGGGLLGAVAWGAMYAGAAPADEPTSPDRNRPDELDYVRPAGAPMPPTPSPSPSATASPKPKPRPAEFDHDNAIRGRMSTIPREDGE